MNTAIFIKEYIKWHIYEAPRELMMAWKNLLWFVYNYFSIPLLTKTLFRPVYRIHEGYRGHGLDLEYIFQSLVVNGISRIAGFVMRVFMISVGILAELFVLLLGPLGFMLWLLLPLLIVASLFIGIGLLF